MKELDKREVNNDKF